MFYCRPKESVLPFSVHVRSFSSPEDSSSASVGKREAGSSKTKTVGITIRRTPEVPESDILGAKPKKPPRGTMTFKPERPSNTTSKTFSRGPFRSSPRVYSSTVLKDFNMAGNQEAAQKSSGDKPPVVLSMPKQDPPPKEQRKQERRVRYKAEIVGSNLIVTCEEGSPDKKQGGSISKVPGAAQAKPVAELNSTMSSASAPPLRKEAAWNELPAACFGGENVQGNRKVSPSTTDAFTQLYDFTFEAGDIVLSPGQVVWNRDDGPVESPAKMESTGRSRSVSVQTVETVSELLLHSPGSETELSRSDVSKRAEECGGSRRLLNDAKNATSRQEGTEAPEENHNGLCASQVSFTEEPPTSSSEIYLDSLVSNGTTSSSPKGDVQQKLILNGCEKNQECTEFLLGELDQFLKQCSPIKSSGDKSFSDAMSTPRMEAGSSDESGSFKEFYHQNKDTEECFSTASDVILINFAEDTTTLKEHLDGLVADYKSKLAGENADSEEDDDLNVLEMHAGSSPTESSAPVLKPADVSPVRNGNPLKEDSPATERLGNCVISSSSGYTGLDSSITPISQINSKCLIFCERCGVYTSSCSSVDNEGIVRVCSCKTRRVKKRGICKVMMTGDEALKEEYRNPAIIPCFVEESVEYVLLESDEEEYEDMKRGVCSVQQGEERKRYPENSSSWNKKDSLTDQDHGPNEASASRGLIYNCPWWTYDHDEDPNSSKNIDDVVIRDLVPTVNTWTLSGAGDKNEGVPECAGTSAEGTNPWLPLLTGTETETAMSSGDHELAEARPTRSDADFSTLYMEGQPRKPSLKQRWGPNELSHTPGFDRDSMSFYEFPMNDPQDMHLQSLSMETLVGSNRLDIASTSSTGENKLMEEDSKSGQGPEPLDDKTSAGDIGGGQSPNAQYCELELYAPVSKSGPAVCTVLVPPQNMPDGDGDKGDSLMEAGQAAGIATPPDDVINSCGDKKIPIPEPKPMGKIRTKFREFFWKHK